MLTRTNNNNLCPVCGSNHGCSYDTSTGVHFCRRTFQDVDNFKFLKESSGFGVFVLRYTKENQPRAFTNKPIKKKERKTGHFKTSELIHTLEKLREVGTLLDQHKQDLLNRGFTDEQIKLYGFMSVTKKMKVLEAGSVAPGFYNGAWFGASGYLCPAFNSKGKWIGYQIKTDSKENGKYIWSKAFAPDNWEIPYNDAAINFLDKGYENPLTLFINDKNSKVLYLSEGLLKTNLIAAKHQVNVLGASGGLFSSSPNQFRETLLRLAPKQVIFLADSGAGNNLNVVRTMEATSKVVENVLGCEMLVSDYGQHFVDKSEKLDADEIDNLTFQTMGTVNFKNFQFQAQDLVSEDVLSALEEVLTSIDTKGSDLNLITNLVSTKYKTTKDLCSPKYNKGRPGFYYNSVKHSELLAQAYSLGYKAVLDVSQPGRGKTHLSGLLKNESFVDAFGFEPDTIFYFAKQHRAPTCSTIETNFFEHPTKNTRLFEAPHKKTPNGKPILMREKQGRNPIVHAGNCFQAEKQEAVYNAGSNESICKTCPFFKKCAEEVSEGQYGYRFQVKEAMMRDRVRANIDGVAPKSIKEHDIAIVDEYSQTLNFCKTYDINAADFFESLPLVNQLTDNKKVITALRQVITGENKLLGKYGFNIGEFFEEYGKHPALLAKAQEASVSQKEHNTQAVLNDELPRLEWVADVFRALSGLDNQTSLTFEKGVIRVYKRNTDLLEKLSKFRMVVYMDATSSRELLATQLGIDPADILLISQEKVTLDHVKIKQCVSLGSLALNRTQTVIDKTKIARERMIEKYGVDNVGFIDWKKFSEPGDLLHFVDGRGSNAFESKKAVVSFGVANTNVTAAKANYEVLYGLKLSNDQRGFRQYYEGLRQSEVLQEVGRLRGTRRPNESLDFWSFSEMNLTFLLDCGFELEIVRGFEIDDRLMNLKDKLLKALKGIKRNVFAKMSIRDFAEVAEVPFSSINQLARTSFKTTGGWNALKHELVNIVFDNPSILLSVLFSLSRRGSKGFFQAKTSFDILQKYDIEFSKVVKANKDHFYSSSEPIQESKLIFEEIPW